MVVIDQPFSGGPKDFPLLSSHELHLWAISTDVTPDILDGFKNALTEKELARAPFFEFKHVRDNYIVSQGALRMLLSGYLDIPPDLLQIGRRSKGKPYSLDDPGLFFNMSNSGKFAVIAFSRDGEVGIDLERIRPLPDLDEMIERNFTSSEIKFILKKPGERIKRFFLFWTVKESYLKALGEGMRLPPDHLEFAIENDQIRHLSVKGVFEQGDWYFKEFSLSKDYVGTIAYGRDNVVIKQMNFN
jgi:4'-phosphopantetheinyl transferase